MKASLLDYGLRTPVGLRLERTSRVTPERRRQSAHDGDHDDRGIIGLPVQELQSIAPLAPAPAATPFTTYTTG